MVSMEQIRVGKTQFNDVFVMDSESYMDDRGSLTKIYSREWFQENNIDFRICEECVIRSKVGVLRGLHTQITVPQPKMLSCIEGKIWVVVVCVDLGSSNLGKWVSVVLERGNSIFVPGSYALGSLALEESVFHIAYGSYYVAEYSSGIRWDDKDLGILWPKEKIEIISDKDKKLQSYSEFIRAQKGKEI